jgi:diguanylate cyclase (GGDEF)-like protein
MTGQRNIGHSSPSLIQLGRRGLFVLGVFALILVGLWLWLSWHNLRQAQLQRMGIAVSLAANQSQSYFDSIGNDLGALAARLQQTDALHYSSTTDDLLSAFKAKHPDLGGVSVLLPSGQLIASTARKPGQRLPNINENPNWRPDFANNLKANGLSINQPQRSYLLDAWIMPLRYTVRDPKGQVSFVIQASILLERQQALWANLGLPPQAQIGLLREDKVLLSMWPLDKGKQFELKPIQAQALAQAIEKSVANGFYRAPAARWSARREGVYQRLRNYPAYTFLSVSNELFLSIWWQIVQVPIFVFLTLFVLGAVIYDWIARRFSRRMQLIQTTLAEGLKSGPALLPSSGVREIDELCVALSDSQNKLEATAQNRERQLLSAADAGTYTVRLRDGVVMQADATFLGMLGRTPEEVLNRSWAALFDESDGSEGVRTGLYANQGLSLRVLRFMHKKGHPVWLSLAEYIDTGEGEPLRQGLAINVSQREELLAKVQVHSDRLRTLWRLATEHETVGVDSLRQMLRLGLDTLGMEVGMISEHEDGVLHVRYKIGTPILFAEGQTSALTDSLCRETVRNKRSQFIEDLASREEYAASRLVADWQLRVYISAPIWVGEHVFGTLTFFDRRLHEQGFSEEDKVFVELLAAWFGKVLFEQRQHHILETLAMTDSLTGLSNRRAAEIQLNAELARAKRADEAFAVAVCDLDRFKLLNDHFGHDVGDEVLRHVSAIMRGALREGDWVARWGGEEFIVFLHHSTGQEAFNAMERMREEIKSRPLQTRHGKLDVTASIGIGIFRRGETDITQILSEADGCLYEAKRRGRDRVVISEAVTKSRLWQAGMLQHALQEKRIVAAYQVMVDLNTGQVVADEALARLIQLDGKVLPAADFVEAAEGINLIHRVDDIIARNAIERYCTRAASGGSGQRIHFINLSPQFLARRDLLDALLCDAKKIAEDAGVNFLQHQAIVLEITERQLLEDFGAMREDLKQLMEYGFRLALDDFGSGYSSFLYLAELPISFIKIEGWMVRNMQYNDRILSMVKSVVMLSKTLGMTTIAECVEDERTAEILRDMGVDWGQGFHFGYPELTQMGTNLLPAYPTGA